MGRVAPAEPTRFHPRRNASLIYLDNNATTLIDPAVANHVAELLHARLANASSQHAAGRAAHKVLEGSRDAILSACGARTRGMSSDQCIFTSGGTESNNLAVFGLASLRPGAIVVSSIEHPSVLAAAQHLEHSGRTVRYLPCDPHGRIELAQLRDWIHAGEVAFVSVMLANNETGVIQSIDEIVQACRPHGVPVHTDAVQALGKIPLDFTALDVDAMTITAHKLHGPLGIGALVVKHGLQLAPHHFGGFQQLGIRPGTEMPALASGMALAVTRSVTERSDRSEHMRHLRDRLESRVLQAIPSAVVLGLASPRLPHTLSIAFPGTERQAVQIALDHTGIACSTGSACASGSSQPSHVLQAMHVSSEVLKSTVRFSLSHETTLQEIDLAAEAIARLIPRLTRSHS